MEAAKAAVNKFTSNRGHHTTVDETVNPVVTRETVKPVRHEEAQQAIDREVHQHHYHTTVQPLEHREQLPEKHTHNVLPTEHREFHHENEGHVKQKIEAELGHFKDTKRVENVRETRSAAPAVTGEHVHHHVHETVVPVVHKETIQPEVVHTTIPVHETHHAASEHHGLSALPTKTLEEFTQSGGVLRGGRHETHEEYDGPPRPYNEKLQTDLHQLGLHETGKTTGHTGGLTTGGSTSTSNSHRTADSGVGGLNEGRRGEYVNDTGSKHSSGLNSGVEGGTKTKPSLLDRLNPRKDADGDGKAGLGD
ncbi:hypothetical protein A1O1_05815 [Capronia coronata CBS 617.96]|uniref:Allergen n=1 Tax=Capronia coronata CBS 617.96 TaxID=1182541 RepID=W9Y898_9EURO|nr:uncharacterized protein A1O1_05815 [Capronia coronata CBS 617.96]EXJ85451.1 hypothetical protein A1O1_05815 [Capronia coronata CBS 617.96]